MRVTVEQDSLRAYSAQLKKAAKDVIPAAKKVTSKGALNIKTDWKKRWKGITRLGGLPRTITYDTAVSGTLVSAEIGVDLEKGGQAPLAFIPEYGVAQHNTRAQPGGAPALAEEAPKYEKALADVGRELLE